MADAENPAASLPSSAARASEKSPVRVKDRQQQRRKLRIISKRNEFRRAPYVNCWFYWPSNGTGYLQEGLRRPPPKVCGLAFATQTGWINRIAGLAVAVGCKIKIACSSATNVI